MEDDSLYEAEVVSCSVQTKPFKDDEGKDVKKVVFKFRIDDPNSQHDGALVWGETSTVFNTHPNNRLRQWAQAILEVELPVGYALDTDVLNGNRCRIVVGLREYKDKEGQIQQKNFVKDLLPLKSPSYS